MYYNLFSNISIKGFINNIVIEICIVTYIRTCVILKQMEMLNMK